MCNNTANQEFPSPYYCPYNRATMEKGVCYYAGPSYCMTDSDCKPEQWSCKLRAGLEWSIGHCVESEDSKTNNICSQVEVFQVDLGALIFVSVVIAINVAKDLREALISEMYFRKRMSNNPIIDSITFGKLFGCSPGDVSAYDLWSTFISMSILYIILFVRKYAFIPMVIAVTASVMVGNSAEDIILNGVAIFFVVEVDNILYSFFLNKDEQTQLENQGTLELDFQETRYLRLMTLLSGAILSGTCPSVCV